ATAGVDVVLRGLTINNLGSSGSGIYMTAGNSLVVQNCVVTNFISASGLYANSALRVHLLDSVLQGNAYGAGFLDGPTVLISGSRFLDNLYSGVGASAGGTGVMTRVEVNRSVAAGNGGVGFYGYSHSGGRAELNVKDSVATRNDTGVYVTSSGGTTLASASNNLISGNTTNGLNAHGGGAKLVASGNKVTHNGTGLAQVATAVLQTTGDNTVSDNTTAFTGTITPLVNM
ncbi:MAG: right-handed parallel beta-helix repeat-containing protein, partial [Burkholderiales bacterium]